MKKLEILRMDVNRFAITPAYATPSSAGLDIAANEDVTIRPGGRELIGTGLMLRLPPGHVGFLCSRPGLVIEKGLVVAHVVETLNEGHLDEIFVLGQNVSDRSIEVKTGELIAQLVIVPVTRVQVELVAGSGGTTRTGESSPTSTGGQLQSKRSPTGTLSKEQILVLSILAKGDRGTANSTGRGFVSGIVVKSLEKRCLVEYYWPPRHQGLPLARITVAGREALEQVEGKRRELP